MTEHAAEILPYMITLLGFLSVYVLTGIKAEISAVKTSLGTIEKDLRNGISSLDRRVSHLEGVVQTEHKNQ